MLTRFLRGVVTQGYRLWIVLGLMFIIWGWVSYSELFETLVCS